MLSKNIHNYTKIQKLFPHEILGSRHNPLSKCLLCLYLCRRISLVERNTKERQLFSSPLWSLCSHIFIFWGVGVVGGGVNNDIYKALKKYFNLRISVENNKIPIFGPPYWWHEYYPRYVSSYIIILYRLYVLHYHIYKQMKKKRPFQEIYKVSFFFWLVTGLAVFVNIIWWK